jgi:uncharacterized membrane protein YgdD (TMEM256/DUF423 family)
LALGAAALLLATVIGAYGTHALAGTVPAATWNAFGTAVDYQFYHGLGLLFVAALTERQPQRWSFRAAGVLLVAGIVLFCGGIYATALGAAPVVGMAVPLGGTAFMAAWLALASGAWLGRGAADALA